VFKGGCAPLFFFRRGGGKGGDLDSRLRENDVGTGAFKGGVLRQAQDERLLKGAINKAPRGAMPYYSGITAFTVEAKQNRYITIIRKYATTCGRLAESLLQRVRIAIAVRIRTGRMER